MDLHLIYSCEGLFFENMLRATQKQTRRDRRVCFWVARKYLFSVSEDSVVPALTSLAIQFDHHVFDLGVVFKGIHGQVLADTALFVATMWHLRGQRQVVIDPDSTELKNATRSHRLEDVARPDRSGQAIDHVVGLFQHFFLGLEATDNNNRTENFTLHNFGVVAVLRYDGRLEEETFFETGNGGTLTTRNDIRAIAQGTLYETFNSGTLGSRDQ